MFYTFLLVQFGSVQSFSYIWFLVTSWTVACQASLSITNSRSLFKLMSIELVMPSNHLIFCHPFLFLPSIFPSISIFSSESVRHIRWPSYWSFSFSNSPSNEYSGLISFRIECFDLLAVHGTLKTLLQHQSSKASILWHSAFFMVQISHPYMTTGKTIALTSQTFVSKVMSLLFNMLSRLVIAFLPRSKRLFISWLKSPSAVILETTVSIVFPTICMKWWDQMPWSLFFECWALSQLFHFPLSLASRGFLLPLGFLPYLRLLIFLPVILIPACASSSPAFWMRYSAYKLNKQCDNIQPWYTPFPILNQSMVPCPVLTVASWPTYRFSRKQVRWSAFLSLRIFQFVVIHTVKCCVFFH